MTAKKDLKRLVRERQQRTGESYVTARRNVLARAEGQEQDAEERPPAIPVVEMISLTEAAQKLGMKCRVVIASTLAQCADPGAVLERVRDALLSTEDDPGTRALRAAVFRGEVPVAADRELAARILEARRFVARALAGIGGVSENGNLLALHVDGHEGSVLVIAHVGFRPVSYPPSATKRPRLVLTTVDLLATGPDRQILSLIP